MPVLKATAASLAMDFSGKKVGKQKKKIWAEEEDEEAETHNNQALSIAVSCLFPYKEQTVHDQFTLANH